MLQIIQYNLKLKMYLKKKEIIIFYVNHKICIEFKRIFQNIIINYLKLLKLSIIIYVKQLFYTKYLLWAKRSELYARIFESVFPSVTPLLLYIFFFWIKGFCHTYDPYEIKHGCHSSLSSPFNKLLK